MHEGRCQPIYFYSKKTGWGVQGSVCFVFALCALRLKRLKPQSSQRMHKARKGKIKNGLGEWAL